MAIADRAELAGQLAFLQNSVGSILEPFSSFLCLRGMRTLALRLQRRVANADGTSAAGGVGALSRPEPPSAGRTGAAADARRRGLISL